MEDQETKAQARRERQRLATRRWRARQGIEPRQPERVPDGVIVHAVPGFSDYGVDEQGRVYTRRGLGGYQGPYGSAIGDWRPMRCQFLGRTGQAGHDYLTVRVGPDGASRRKRVMVHALVAAVFLGPRPSGADVAHNNGNPRDNSADNLRYATPGENKRDEVHHGRRYRGDRHHNTVLSDATWITLLSRLNAGESQASLSREYRISRQAIWRRTKGSPGGYSWATIRLVTPEMINAGIEALESIIDDPDLTYEFLVEHIYRAMIEHRDK